MAMFVASATVVSGLIYGFSLELEKVRGCGDGCYSDVPPMPVIYIGAGDSGRTIRLTKGQVIEVDLGSRGTRRIPYTVNWSILTETDAPGGPTVKRFTADQRGTARIIAVTGSWCTSKYVCSVGPPPSAIATPGFELTVMVRN
jgi:hypothetical protein